MNELPYDIYEAIFDHLHLIDLARLRQVCKGLRSIVQNYRIRELVIGSEVLVVNTFTLEDAKEYQNGVIHRPRNLKRTTPFRIQTRSLGDPLFDQISSPVPTVKFLTYDIFFRSRLFNVQFLKSFTFTYPNAAGYSGLNEVNKLILLERLEIKFDSYKPYEPDHDKLSLPNLKTLLLDSYNDWLWPKDANFKMEIEAPKCEGLHLGSNNLGKKPRLLIRFLSPVNSVKHLSLHAYHKSSHVFESIEFLQIVRGDLIDERTFVAFPCLKTLKILEHNSLEGLKQLFRLSKKHNVKLVFHGIQLADGSELDAFEESDFSSSGFSYAANYGTLNRFLDNFDQLEEGLNFVTRIEFSEKVGSLLEADVGRFLRIFNSLKEISTERKIERPEQFLQLATCCDNLQRLHIQNSGLPQQCFDQLGNIRTLTALHIEEKTKVDLSFTFKLPILSHLTTNHDVDLKKEIRFNEREGLQLRIEKRRFYLTITKQRADCYPEGRYVLVKTEKLDLYDLRIKKPEEEREHLENFEYFVSRYEETRDFGVGYVIFDGEYRHRKVAELLTACRTARKLNGSR